MCLLCYFCWPAGTFHGNWIHILLYRNSPYLSFWCRWSFLKLAFTKRLWTPCFTRQCRCLTTPCWRPRVGATPTAALTVRKRRGQEELNFASVFVESTSRDTAHTMTGNWDTKTETINWWTDFCIDNEHPNILKLMNFFLELFSFFYLYLRSPNYSLDEFASDFI